MTKRVFSLLSLLFLSCAAGSIADAQVSAPCDPTLPSDPSYYADMKEMPKGEWKLSYNFDMEQYQNTSVTVVVRGLQGISSQKHRAGKLRCAELENRSARVVKAVQLRWVVTAREEAKKVLAQGTLPLIEVEIAAGGKLKVELRDAHFADFLQPLLKDGVVTGDYNLSVGVARVEFADGTLEEMAGTR